MILRKMKEDDADALFEIFSDPIAMRHFGVIFDRPKMDQWVRNNLEHDKQHGFSLLSVVLKDSGEVIGDCGLETDEIEGRTVVGMSDLVGHFWVDWKSYPGGVLHAPDSFDPIQASGLGVRGWHRQ